MHGKIRIDYMAMLRSNAWKIHGFCHGKCQIMDCYTCRHEYFLEIDGTLSLSTYLISEWFVLKWWEFGIHTWADNLVNVWNGLIGDVEQSPWKTRKNEGCVGGFNFLAWLSWPSHLTFKFLGWVENRQAVLFLDFPTVSTQQDSHPYLLCW